MMHSFFPFHFDGSFYCCCNFGFATRRDVEMIAVKADDARRNKYDVDGYIHILYYIIICNTYYSRHCDTFLRMFYS